MPTPAPYDNLPARLLTVQAAAVAAYVRHARHPERVGADAAHRRHWATAYEARAALAEQNPAFAALLVAPTGSAPTPGASGLPLLPAGVRWVVDQDGPGTVTLSVDVAGAVTLLVTPPNLPAFAVVPVATATRATATFAAPVDGLYRVALAVGGAALAVLYGLVTRTEIRLFREDSRAQRLAFAPLPRPLSPAYLARLARLAGAEALARTGQPLAAAAALASIRALPAAPTPTGLFAPCRPC